MLFIDYLLYKYFLLGRSMNGKRFKSSEHEHTEKLESIPRCQIQPMVWNVAQLHGGWVKRTYDVTSKIHEILYNRERDMSKDFYTASTDVFGVFDKEAVERIKEVEFCYTLGEDSETSLSECPLLQEGREIYRIRTGTTFNHYIEIICVPINGDSYLRALEILPTSASTSSHRKYRIVDSMVRAISAGALPEACYHIHYGAQWFRKDMDVLFDSRGIIPSRGYLSDRMLQQFFECAKHTCEVLDFPRVQSVDIRSYGVSSDDRYISIRREHKGNLCACSTRVRHHCIDKTPVGIIQRRNKPPIQKEDNELHKYGVIGGDDAKNEGNRAALKRSQPESGPILRYLSEISPISASALQQGTSRDNRTYDPRSIHLHEYKSDKGDIRRSICYKPRVECLEFANRERNARKDRKLQRGHTDRPTDR